MTSLILSDTLSFREESPGIRGSGCPLRMVSFTHRELVTECLEMIQVSSQQLLTLINNLLDVRKINSGLMETVHMECIDVGQIIQRCVLSLNPLANLSNISLCVGCGVWSGQAEDRLAMGAVLPIEQVLINLVGNAIKTTAYPMFSVAGPPL